MNATAVLSRSLGILGMALALSSPVLATDDTPSATSATDQKAVLFERLLPYHQWIGRTVNDVGGPRTAVGTLGGSSTTATTALPAPQILQSNKTQPHSS